VSMPPLGEEIGLTRPSVSIPCGAARAPTGFACREAERTRKDEFVFALPVVPMRGSPASCIRSSRATALRSGGRHRHQPPVPQQHERRGAVDGRRPKSRTRTGSALRLTMR